MGFFSPANSTNRYVGIWYNIKDSESKEVVWIANRNNPVSDSFGVLKMSKDDNLHLLDGKDIILWSSNVSFPGTRFTIDLSEINRPLNKEEYPVLRSWKSASDPSNGRFWVGMICFPVTEFVIRNGDEIYWRSGPWNGTQLLGVPYVSSEEFHIVYNDRYTTLDVSYSVLNDSLLQYFAITHDGNAVRKIWDDGRREWKLFRQSFQSECDTYGKCGLFGQCNPTGSPICHCLHGFEPNNKDEWREGNWTSGCVQRKQLLCGIAGPKEDGFLQLKHMKVPHSYYIASSYSQDACRSKCLETCPCVAYAHSKGIGCMIWENLIDTQTFSNDGVDLFIRLAHSELGETSSRKTIIIVTAILAAAAFVGISYCFWSLWYRRHVKKSRLNKNPYSETQFLDDQAEFKDLPLFKLKELEVATINFSEINKLGEGGFGLVYKVINAIIGACVM